MLLSNERKEQKELIIKASLLLFGVALNSLEFFIPRIPIFPWLKPGLANIVTLVWIIRYGFVESLLYSLLRVWIVSFYFGFSFFTFSLSFSGALCASGIMACCWQAFGKRGLSGTVGIAVIGALFHNVGQLGMVYILMAHNSHLFYQFPFMALASVFFGTIVGLVSPVLLSIISDETLFAEAGLPETVKAQPAMPPIYGLYSSLLFIFCMVLVFISRIDVLVIVAGSITVAIQILMRGSLHALFYPVKRFWILFFFVGALHLFFTYGTRYSGLPYITHEGVREAVTQWLRLWTWLEATFLFLHFRFQVMLLALLEKGFPRHRTTIEAGVLAVEFFPVVVAMVTKNAYRLIRLLVTKPSQAIQDLFIRVAECVICQDSPDETV